MEQYHQPGKTQIPWEHEFSYGNQYYRPDPNVQTAPLPQPYQPTLSQPYNPAVSPPYQAAPSQAYQAAPSQPYQDKSPVSQSTTNRWKWSKKKKLIIFGGSAVIIVAIIIGVAVGVTQAQSHAASYCRLNPEAASCGGCLAIANGKYC